MIQRLNNDPCHVPTLDNDSGQDLGDTFSNETQIMHNNSPIKRESPESEKVSDIVKNSLAAVLPE